MRAFRGSFLELMLELDGLEDGVGMTPPDCAGALAQRRRHPQYDFSNAKPNPYAKRLKKQVTIRLDQESLTYFQNLAEKCGIQYQTLINLYLRNCAASGKRLQLHWLPDPEKGAA